MIAWLLAVVVDPEVVARLLQSVGWSAVAAAWVASAVVVQHDPTLTIAGYYAPSQRVVVVSRVDGPLLSHEAEHVWDDLRGPNRETRRLDLERLTADPALGWLAQQAIVSGDDLHYYHNLRAWLGGDVSTVPADLRATYYGFLAGPVRYRIVLPVTARR
jgi:hypothetical protein